MTKTEELQALRRRRRVPRSQPIPVEQLDAFERLLTPDRSPGNLRRVSS